MVAAPREACTRGRDHDRDPLPFRLARRPYDQHRVFSHLCEGNRESNFTVLG